VATLSDENRQHCNGLIKAVQESVIRILSHRTDGEFERMQKFAKGMVRQESLLSQHDISVEVVSYVVRVCSHISSVLCSRRRLEECTAFEM
jgi:hypothetical protein